MQYIMKICPEIEGYEVDADRSTEDTIVYKKKKQVKTWEQIPGVGGYFISGPWSTIQEVEKTKGFSAANRNIALTEKHCKMMLAIAQISQLMPYYGGEVSTTLKLKGNQWPCIGLDTAGYDVFKIFTFPSPDTLLTFRTMEQAEDFLKNNERLVRDYYMLD